MNESKVERHRCGWQVDHHFLLVVLLSMLHIVLALGHVRVSGGADLAG